MKQKAKTWQKQQQNPNNPPVMSSEARKRISSYKESTVEEPYGFTTRAQRVNGVEVFAISVEKETGSDTFSGDSCLLQVNSSNNAFASCKSFVSNPSVNQW
jgi:hypothetical protein